MARLTVTLVVSGPGVNRCLSLAAWRVSNMTETPCGSSTKRGDRADAAGDQHRAAHARHCSLLAEEGHPDHRPEHHADLAHRHDIAGRLVVAHDGQDDGVCGHGGESGLNTAVPRRAPL